MAIDSPGTKRRAVCGLLLALGMATAGCGEREHDEAKDDSGKKEQEKSEPAPGDLTAFQLEHGIGPVTEKLEPGPIDKALVVAGQAVFDTKCSMCHKMDTTYVGPSLGEVTTRRTPAYILNMILNPQEMVERHPVAKQLLAERMTFMPNQQLSREDARAVLEYLRTQAKGSTKP